MGIGFCFGIENTLVVDVVDSNPTRSMDDATLSVEDASMYDRSIGIVEESDISWLGFRDETKRQTRVKYLLRRIARQLDSR